MRKCPKCHCVLSFAGDRVFCPNCKEYIKADDLHCMHDNKKGECYDKNCEFKRK